MSKQKVKRLTKTIALNKKSKRDYFIKKKYEAGIALLGWEVKSLRAGKISLSESYVHVRNYEAWLIGTLVTPLATTCTTSIIEPGRERKLLLNRNELSDLQAQVDQKGFTCICIAIYWKRHVVKCEIALAKGKALHDKRFDDKKRDWEIQKQRLLRTSN
ncbi:MAG: SsrA-binding protein [Cellvibrionales bacterium TMED49]|nr:SsrA-binding protein [Porticoccaceae bacterium]OUU39341.1 MAG: SsrA-binding protein [Cellvibrionales bacterium TMED49]|tara:strand:- start:46 stop:522 length:477 start_codon:yes stop_codon:yes gene_type:complete